MSEELDDLNRRIEEARRGLSDLYKQRKALTAHLAQEKPTMAMVRAKTAALIRSGCSIEMAAGELGYTPATICSHLRQAALDEAYERNPWIEPERPARFHSPEWVGFPQKRQRAHDSWWARLHRLQKEILKEWGVEPLEVGVGLRPRKQLKPKSSALSRCLKMQTDPASEAQR